MSRAILVVDDEPVLAGLLAMLLQDEGFTVRTATNGADALNQLAAAPTDLIISDVMMPVMSGVALAETLRERGDATPVILISAVKETVRHLTDVPFLRKPFDLDDLMVLVLAALARVGAHGDR